MRVDIKKFLCVGPDSQRDLFFREAQQAGVIEFIDAKATHSTEWPSELQEMKMAYHAIHTDDSMEQRPFGKDWTACLLTQRILDSLKDEEQCIEELRHLKLEIARVEPFGVFSKHLIIIYSC